VITFFDASALVKRYVSEPGSGTVRSLLRRKHRAVSALSSVEIPAALWRRVREGDIDEKAVRRQVARIVSDLRHFDVVEPRGRVLALARDLVERHPLRAYDAVQLASALHLARATGLSLAFASADVALGEAAEAEGARRVPLG